MEICKTFQTTPTKNNQYISAGCIVKSLFSSDSGALIKNLSIFQARSSPKEENLRVLLWILFFTYRSLMWVRNNLQGKEPWKDGRVCVCSWPPASVSEENGKQIKKACQLQDQWKTAISLKVVGGKGVRWWLRRENENEEHMKLENTENQWL